MLQEAGPKGWELVETAIMKGGRIYIQETQWLAVDNADDTALSGMGAGER